MDINCGEVIDGTKNLEEIGTEIFELIIRVASNEKIKFYLERRNIYVSSRS